MIPQIVDLLMQGKIGAIFKGKAEMGSRALGNRSIIADPRLVNGKDLVNNVKQREWYRPFAASVLLEEASNWFEMGKLKSSPWMLYAFPVKHEKAQFIPCVIHVDETCRIQTLKEDQNLHFYNLIKCFYYKTGIPILFNTSFNLSGDPLVETIDDALYTLRNSNLNYLYLPEKKWMIT